MRSWLVLKWANSEWKQSAAGTLHSLLAIRHPPASLAPALRFRRRQQALQMRHVIEQGLAAALGERVAGLRLALDEAFLGSHVTGVLELAQMHAGIAVGGADRVADDGEIRLSGTCQVGHHGEPHPALQQLVDRIV